MKDKPKTTATVVVQKPQRTPKEWREIHALKLRQWIAIGQEAMGNKRRGGIDG